MRKILSLALAIVCIISYFSLSVTAIETNSQDRFLVHWQHQLLGNVITVDDEPGDANYTSIQEAVNHSTAGDIIEVYSGTYNESDITVLTPEITLSGIAHELGNGNDTGKPFVCGSSERTIFSLNATSLHITGFQIKNIQSGVECYDVLLIKNADYCIITDNDMRGEASGIRFWVPLSNCVIHNNTFKNFNITALIAEGDNNTITNNTFSTFGTSIRVSGNHCMIRGNIINGQEIHLVTASYNSIINNTFEGNASGINIGELCWYNTVQGNTFKNSGQGVFIASGPWMLLDSGPSSGNVITQNNFFNSSASFIYWTLTKHRNQWDGNYWSDHTGTGPQIIHGKMVYFYIWIPWAGGAIFTVPWVNVDRHPAQEPYHI